MGSILLRLFAKQKFGIMEPDYPEDSRKLQNERCLVSSQMSPTFTHRLLQDSSFRARNFDRKSKYDKRTNPQGNLLTMKPTLGLFRDGMHVAMISDRRNELMQEGLFSMSK